jgi:multicomponent Na+:H+ antiporter subunit F
MHTGSSTLDLAYSVGFTVIPIILAIMVFFCLARAIKGPKIADRIVAINMMGTLTMVIIAVLAVKMNEGYLVDICIIYAMISFLAVTLLTKVYMGVYAERHRHASEIGMEKKENIENREVSHDDSATVD